MKDWYAFENDKSLLYLRMYGEKFQKNLKKKIRQLLFKVDSLFDFLFLGNLFYEQRGGKWSVQKNFTVLKEAEIFILKKSTESTLASFYSSRRKIYFVERRKGSAWRNFATLEKKNISLESIPYFLSLPSIIIIKHVRLFF